MTSIKGPIDRVESRPVDGEEIRLVDAIGKGLVDKEEIRPADVKRSVNAKVSTNTEDLVVIYYIQQY